MRRKEVRGREAQGMCVSERGQVLAPGLLHFCMPGWDLGYGERYGPGSD